MCRKMISHGIAVMGIAILVFLSIGSASAPPYAGPNAEVTYIESDVQKVYLSKDPAYYHAGTGFKLRNSRLDWDNSRVRVGTGPSGSDFIDFYLETINIPSFAIRYENSPSINRPSAIYLSVHPKDPAKPKANLYYRLDRIEGLISLEEAQAIVARKEAAEAERKAQAEAQRLAQEEANRYNPANFIIVPTDFRPANYTSRDLFGAVSNSRNLRVSSNKQDAFDRQAITWGLEGDYILRYVSDLTFVRQNGTDIRFSSDDNAITQDMTIDQRSGLQAGQRVRVYYIITRSPLTTWDVIAIERR